MAGPVPAMFFHAALWQLGCAAASRAGRTMRGKSERVGRSRAPVWWYGLMVLGGFGFGMLADRRPFGEGFLVHPFVLFFILVGLALIALRVLMARPVPEIISDRALIAGCFVGLASFLAGNFVGVQWMVAH